MKQQPLVSRSRKAKPRVSAEREGRSERRQFTCDLIKPLAKESLKVDSKIGELEKTRWGVFRVANR